MHPELARQGIGRSILEECEEAIRAAQFSTVDLVATLSGEPLYAAFGYNVMERYEIPLAGEVKLSVVKMSKCLTANHPSAPLP